MTTVVRRMPDVRQRRLASDTAFWGLIFADMTVFALFFVAYLWQFGSNRSEFQAYAAYLVVGLGLIDALILLTSSYLVVRAVQKPSGRHRCRDADRLGAPTGGGIRRREVGGRWSTRSRSAPATH